MLRAIVNVSQDEPGIVKHWFESDFFDLYLWRRDGEVVHMQLCYDCGRPTESAVSWKEGAGLFHDGVDATRRTESPVLERGGAFDAERVNARFLRESVNLPADVRRFVLAKLHEFALDGPVRRNRPPRAVVRRQDWQRRPAAG